MAATPVGSSTSTPQTTQTKPNTQTQTTSLDEKKSGLSGDFNTFLKLLTSQLQNQDPLQPMDSTEFVAQLASFSGVEQQVGSNTRLDKILTALSGSSTEGYATWIGKQVRTATSAAFKGQPIEVSVNKVSDTDSAVLVVKNDFGRVVARQSVGTGHDSVTWDGTDSNGAAAANGNYSFQLESYKGQTLKDTQDGQVFATVNEVRLDDNQQALLVLENGDQIATSKVTAIR